MVEYLQRVDQRMRQHLARVTLVPGVEERPLHPWAPQRASVSVGHGPFQASLMTAESLDDAIERADPHELIAMGALAMTLDASSVGVGYPHFGARFERMLVAELARCSLPWREADVEL